MLSRRLLAISTTLLCCSYSSNTTGHLNRPSPLSIYLVTDCPGETLPAEAITHFRLHVPKCNEKNSISLGLETSDISKFCSNRSNDVFGRHSSRLIPLRFNLHYLKQSLLLQSTNHRWRAEPTISDHCSSGAEPRLHEAINCCNSFAIYIAIFPCLLITREVRLDNAVCFGVCNSSKFLPYWVGLTGDLLQVRHPVT